MQRKYNSCSCSNWPIAQCAIDKINYAKQLNSVRSNAIDFADENRLLCHFEIQLVSIHKWRTAFNLLRAGAGMWPEVNDCESKKIKHRNGYRRLRSTSTSSTFTSSHIFRFCVSRRIVPCRQECMQCHSVIDLENHFALNDAMPFTLTHTHMSEIISSIGDWIVPNYVCLLVWDDCSVAPPCPFLYPKRSHTRVLFTHISGSGGDGLGVPFAHNSNSIKIDRRKLCRVCVWLRTV